jgi:drug/metabolite transporter (DMT)-like permease
MTRSSEAAGFLASLLFTGLASVRDVYFGGLLQSTSPLGVAVLAFGLCGALFLPIALVRSPASLRALLRRRRDLFWVNATTALAWISFFYALRTIEPLLVQILFAGVGPLSVVWIDRLTGLAPSPLGAGERPIHLGLLASLLLAAGVVLGGLSGAGPQPLGPAALGIGLAAGAGVSISASTVISRRLNDVGVAPAALISLRFVGATVIAGALAVATGERPAPFDPLLLAAVLALIVLPNYVNQIGISLASPLTVRAVMALAPVLIFALQLVEGRLSASRYSLGVGVLYGVFALSAAAVRGQRASQGVEAGSMGVPASAPSATRRTWRAGGRGPGRPASAPARDAGRECPPGTPAR